MLRRTLDEFGFTAHIRSRGEEAAIKREAGFKARRWVVEPWLNRRRILVRWDKSPDNYIAFLHSPARPQSCWIIRNLEGVHQDGRVTLGVGRSVVA